MARLSKVRLAERRAEEWDLYVRGKTQPEIARMYGLDTSTICDDLRIHAEGMPPQARNTVIRRHEETIAWAIDELRRLVVLDGVPVTAGKDGYVVMDPETHQVVRDYGARFTAIREVRGYLDREAKLLGLNAADKVEVSGSVTFEGSVDAELQELADQLGMNGPVRTDEQSANELNQDA